MCTAKEAIEICDIDQLITAAKTEKSRPNIYGTTNYDVLFRNRLMELVKFDVGNLEEQLKLIRLTIDTAKHDLNTKNLAILLLGDLLDLTPLSQCTSVFTFIEEQIDTWKSDFFYDACRNYLLRICNDLLRRVSRVVNTAFCGRILVFLAKCLPLTEKSGLNIVSLFNSDNDTQFDEQEIELETEEEKKNEVNHMDVDAPAEPGLIDFALYRKFWSLQNFFAAPLSCFDALNWRKFTTNANDVLKVLQTWKLEQAEEITHTVKKLRDAKRSSISGEKEDAYFAKYLTNQKLLQLQLGDPLFRRFVLTQFLVVFQFFQADTKVRNDRKMHLNSPQLSWIEETTEKIYVLLSETQPGGADFAQTMKNILKRELVWNDWKNKNCFDYTERAEKNYKMPTIKKRRGEYNPDIIDMGNPVLTRLWKLTDSNLDACKDPKRKFVPPIEEFLQEPFDQTDPQSIVPNDKKIVRNENWQWRAARFMSTHSSHYHPITPNKDVVRDVGIYLEAVVKETANDIPKFKTLLLERELMNAEKEEGKVSEENDIQFNVQQLDDMETEMEGEPLVNEDQLKELSEVLKDDWVDLAKALALSKESIAAHQKKSDAKEVVKVLLDQWMEANGAAATPRRLRNLLLKAEFHDEQIYLILNDKIVEASKTPPANGVEK